MCVCLALFCFMYIPFPDPLNRPAGSAPFLFLFHGYSKSLEQRPVLFPQIGRIIIRPSSQPQPITARPPTRAANFISYSSVLQLAHGFFIQPGRSEIRLSTNITCIHDRTLHSAIFIRHRRPDAAPEGCQRDEAEIFVLQIGLEIISLFAALTHGLWVAYLSVYPFINLSIHLYLSESIFLYLYLLFLSIYLYGCLSVYLYITVFIKLNYLYIYPFVSVSLYLFDYLSISPSIFRSIYLFLYLFIHTRTRACVGLIVCLRVFTFGPKGSSFPAPPAPKESATRFPFQSDVFTSRNHQSDYMFVKSN